MTELERRQQEFLAKMLGQGGPSPAPQMSPVPDQQGQMSPENMTVLRGQAAYDPGDREAILAEQLRGGRDQVFAQGPQGKMMGNIYAAPSWSENLSGAVKKGLGGLEMARARKGLKEVDGLRGVQSEATGALNEIAQQKADAQQATENDQKNVSQGILQATLDERKKHNEDTLIADAAQREADAQRRADAEAVRVRELAETRAESKRRHDETEARLKASADRQEEKLGKAEAKEIRRQDEKYQAERTKSGLPGARAIQGELADVITDYAVRGEDGQWVLKEGVTEIPGIGGASNVPILGDVATYGADALRGNDAGKNIKQSAQKLYNVEIKDTSGSAVSAHEMLRNLRAQGVDMWSGPENFLRGVNAIEAGYDAIDNELNMTFPEAYERRQAMEAQIAAEEAAKSTAETFDDEEEAIYQAWKRAQGL